MNHLLPVFTLCALFAFSVGSFAQSGGMQITSPAFANNGTIPVKYTCDGDKISPALVFSRVPASSRSLVVIIEDPDVPKTLRPDGMFDHWLVWDIAPLVKTLEEADRRSLTEGLNGTGSAGYVPPCPPDREHRYFFKLFALDTMLGGAKITNKADLLAAMKGHILTQAELIGKYNRPQNK